MQSPPMLAANDTDQCSSNVFIPSPPFHSRHVAFATLTW